MGMVRRGAADRSGERGSVVLMALLVLVLLGGAFALLAGLLIHRMHRVQRDLRHTELTALADAAMAETLANLAASPSYPGVSGHALGDGSIRTTVHHGPGGEFTVELRVTVRGDGMAAEAQGKMTATGPRVTSWRRVPAAEAGAAGKGEVEGGLQPPPGR